MAKLGTVLDQIDAGSMLLPEFQRGYVWNRDQVRGLMRSFYLGYPVGALLVWATEGVPYATRGSVSTTSGGPKHLLLDGQQRVTTLYGIVRGRAPSFFEGDPAVFSGLHFHVESESFQFYVPSRMKGDPLWVDVTKLFVDKPESRYGPLLDRADLREKLGDYLGRLSRLHSILERELHVEQITGEDKTVDVVVDIFNKANSGGTKLSKGDLALARICAEWADARPTMRRSLENWNARGLRFTADWLLRNINAAATGRAPFSALEDVSAEDFQLALLGSLKNIDQVLDLLAARLGIDHDRVLMGRYAIPVITRLLFRQGGHFSDELQADRALYWYVHAAVRGRFAGSTETYLARDLEAVDDGGIDGVIANLSRARKDVMTIDAIDFEGVGRGSRSYPLLYLLSRVLDARDLSTGAPLDRGASAVEVHEIFPKAQLVRHGFARSEVSAIANFAFIAPESARDLRWLAPHYYLADCSPEVLSSQWIPQDPKLWQIESFREFLDARRELLAAAATDMLDRLYAGTLPSGGGLPSVTVVEPPVKPDPRRSQIAALVTELTEKGFARPALDVEVPDPDTGIALAVAEAFWADGLQPGLGKPVVLELDPEEADLQRLAELGCDVFTSVDALRNFVDRLIVDPDPESDPEPVVTSDPDVSDDFHTAVLSVMERCKNELSYNPRYFRIMVSQHGALGAVRKLLAAPAVSDGFVALWERQRLDLSIEALVLDNRFAAIFSEDERDVARNRLVDFGYAPIPA